ncbi:MAG: efflux RND transporter periplasmic adaptor subunit [Ignavibacteriales bacterium]|nr:efflux RND transporter periplasmic adaptor subunit [Ignavibacteriales bacterium]
MKLTKIISAIVFAIVLLFLYSCGNSDGKENDKTKEKEKLAKTTNVEVVELKNNSYTDYITVVGVIKPVYQADLTYQEGGIVSRFIHGQGSWVNKGDTILVIDNDVLKASLDAAKAQYELAQITFEKQETVYKDNINSEYQYLQAKYTRDQALANYNLVKARYEKTFIKAPFSGVVDKKFIDIGEMVIPGAPIVSIINTGSLKIEAGIPERFIGKINRGSNAKIYIQDILEKPIEGKISYVGATVSTSNRTFNIEINISNYNKLLKPEQSAEVLIEVEKYDNIISIPEEVVIRTDNSYVVFIANEGKAEMREIEILNRYEKKIAVKSGLKEGEKLIVVGYQNLINGENINVVN